MAHVSSALIVGASRGLGLLLAKQLAARGWRVTATARSSAADLDDAAAGSDGRLRVAYVDMTDSQSIRNLHDDAEGAPFDLLFVNGAVNRSAGSIDDAGDDEFVEVMVTNALAPLRVIASLQDLVADDGVVGVMSSEQGSVSKNEEDGFEVYKASKAALNQLMRSYANRTADAARALLLVDPGHNRTELGGSDAPLDPEESMRLVADLLERARGTSGLRFVDRDGAVVPW